ncbi:tryptophan synthase beta subunit-like PLP-dependent enzyme [Apiospora arundinis]
MAQLSRKDIIEAHSRLTASVTKTPCILSLDLSAQLQEHLADSATSAQVFLKLENLQIGGSFKYRGAMNALSQLDADELAKGIVTYSSGNHARGLLEVAHVVSRLKQVEIPLHVVMPEQAAAEKRRAVQDLGAHLYQEPGGHGTIALEFVGQVQEYEELHQGHSQLGKLGTGALDVLLVPCGGGGLLAGCLVALEGTDVLILACEPVAGGGSQLLESLRQGRRVPRDERAGPSAADGLRSEIGDASWAIISERMTERDVIQVSEEQITAALEVSQNLGLEGVGRAQLCGFARGATLQLGVVETDAL